MNEEEIKEYMSQFKVDRKQAIKEINNILEEYYISMEETLESIKQDMH